MSRARYSFTPANAWLDDELTLLQCRLLGLIGSYLDQNREAWPSQTTLSERLNCSRRSVTTAIKVLKNKGYIRVENRYRDDGGQTSNLYLVNLDEVSRNFHPPEKSGLRTPPEAQDCAPPAQPRLLTMKEPIEGTQLTDTARELRDQIWSLAPDISRKRSSKKKVEAALKVQLKTQSPEQLLSAWKNYLSDPDTKRDGFKFVPAIDRWFRDQRYESWLCKPDQKELQTRDEKMDFFFKLFAEEGKWWGFNQGFPIHPHSPKAAAEYPEHLYKKYGVKRCDTTE
ncbi:MAG: helix-turn-helix domain-containing protein [Henriciella sp.]